MPSTVNEHYDDLLAEHYDWMFGVPFDDKVAEQRTLLQELLATARVDGIAVDLGCGSGFQSVALAELAYKVLAIDTSQKLLEDLADRIGSRDITIKQADLLGLDSLVTPSSVSVVVCMGDTLTHVTSRAALSGLFRSVHRALRPGGRFVLTYRDLAQGELEGIDRFIHVRGDERRVMTCFLEFEDSEHVVVHDLVNIRNDRGVWTLQKSSYRKLRLPAEWVCDELIAAGLSVTTHRPGRLSMITATKPDEVVRA